MVFFGYACTIILYLNHIEQPKWEVWTQFLTTLSISATITSNIIKTKSCFHHLFSVHVLSLCTVSAILHTQSLVAPHSRHCKRLEPKKSFWWLAQWKSWWGEYCFSYNPGRVALNYRDQSKKPALIL